MNKNQGLILGISILTAFNMPLVSADQVFLKNGDRFSGKISSMAGNALKFETAYSEIKIPWDAIESISSEEQITLELADDSQIKGVLMQTPQGISLQNPTFGQAMDFNLDDIQAINPEDPNEMKVDGSIHVGGYKASGNTDNQSFHADGEVIVYNELNKFMLGGIYNQASNNDSESANNFRAYTQFDHFFYNNWYASFFTDFSKDKFQDLNFRSLFGAGVGHKILDTELQYFLAEAGVAYTIEDYEDEQDREFISGRWAIDYKFWLIEDRLQFFHDHAGIVSLEDVGDILVRSHTGFKYPVYNGIDLLTQVDVDYDTRPAAGRDNMDTRYIVGVGYRW